MLLKGHLTCLTHVIQIGTIGVMTANGDSVDNILLRAKEISSVLDLPIFLTGFSTALGMNIFYLQFSHDFLSFILSGDL